MNSSKNLKEFFANTKARFSGKFGQAFLATLISVFPFALIIFGAAWLSQLVHGLFAIVAVIAIFIIGNMQVGHIKYVRKLTEGEKPSLKLLFAGFTGKNCLNYLFLGIVLFVTYLFAGILFFVPLIFAVGSFSMVFYFAEHHDYDNFLDALSTSAKRMRRNRANMYAYKALFYIAYVLLLIVYTIALIFLLAIKVPAVSILCVVLLHIAIYVLFSIITTVYSFCNFNFFVEVLDYHERKNKKAVMPEIVKEEEVAKEEKITKVSATKPRTTKTATTENKTTKTKTTTKKAEK